MVMFIHIFIYIYRVFIKYCVFFPKVVQYRVSRYQINQFDWYRITWSIFKWSSLTSILRSIKRITSISMDIKINRFFSISRSIEIDIYSILIKIELSQYNLQILQLWKNNNTGCSGNNVFIHNSLQPLPRLYPCKRPSKLSTQCECTVTPISWYFLYNQ